jgi:hypothetical protein
MNSCRTRFGVPATLRPTLLNPRVTSVVVFGGAPFGARDLKRKLRPDVAALHPSCALATSSSWITLRLIRTRASRRSSRRAALESSSSRLTLRTSIRSRTLLGSREEGHPTRSPAQPRGASQGSPRRPPPCPPSPLPRLLPARRLRPSTQLISGISSSKIARIDAAYSAGPQGVGRAAEPATAHGRASDGSLTHPRRVRAARDAHREPHARDRAAR